MFELAESSDFLKGKNGKNWSATFDWMVKDANMAKILDGNYSDKKEGGDNGEQNGEAGGSASYPGYQEPDSEGNKRVRSGADGAGIRVRHGLSGNC